VTDNGIGIPAEMRERIFEMFAQIEHPTDKAYAGLGIGLTLVKSLVELHDGRITVESPGCNQGSTFSVQLSTTKELPEVEQESTTVSASQTGCRVLIVDDNQAAAQLLGVVVKTLGNEVRRAGDGQEAIAVAAAFRPHVILMDIGMPRMNGYEAAQHIRQQTWGQGIKLVALTGWGQEEDRRRTKEAGFDHHLTKPAEPSELEKLFREMTASQAGNNPKPLIDQTFKSNEEAS
ncbi:MAG: response regulator, partial [Pirellulales bacterium]